MFGMMHVRENIVCDAAKSGLGWTILQRQEDGKLHALSYGGMATTEAQQKWTAAQLEIASVAAALKTFEAYFLQRKVTVLSDNISVLHFHKLQFASPRERRLAVYLSQFNLNIKFIRGVHNLAADALSRAFENMTEEEREIFQPKSSNEDFIFQCTADATDEENSTDVTNDNLNDLLPQISETDYSDDSEFALVFNYLKNGELTNDDSIDRKTLMLADQFFIQNGKLFRLELPRAKRVARVQTLNQRLCIPVKYREMLLKAFHDHLGHAASRKLYLSMSQRLFWQNLFPDIQQYTLTCDVCQRTKINKNKTVTPLHPLEAADRPFQRWHLDFKTFPRATSQGCSSATTPTA